MRLIPPLWSPLLWGNIPLWGAHPILVPLVVSIEKSPILVKNCMDFFKTKPKAMRERGVADFSHIG
jgi:hypothetical protein